MGKEGRVRLIIMIKLISILAFISILLPIVARSQDFSNLAPCNEIEIEYDKYNNDSTLRIPIVEGLNMINIIKHNVADYYICIRLDGYPFSITTNGLTIQLSNNSLVEMPNTKIDIDPNTKGSYNYTALILLNENQLKLLRSFPVTYFKLCTHEKKIVNGKQLTTFINCLNN